MSVPEQLRAYPSSRPTLTPTCNQLTVVEFAEGRLRCAVAHTFSLLGILQSTLLIFFLKRFTVFVYLANVGFPCFFLSCLLPSDVLCR